MPWDRSLSMSWRRCVKQECCRPYAINLICYRIPQDNVSNFHVSSAATGCWKNPLVISMDENMIEPPKLSRIASCRGRGYALGITFVLSLRISTMMRGLSFFQTTKAGDAKGDAAVRGTFSICPPCSNGSKMASMASQSRGVSRYAGRHRPERSSSLRCIGISMPSLKRLNSGLKRLACLRKTEETLALYHKRHRASKLCNISQDNVLGEKKGISPDISQKLMCYNIPQGNVLSRKRESLPALKRL